MKTKICSKCEQTKSIKEFSVSRANKDGLDYYCKECRKENAKQYYQKNPEKYKEKIKEYRKANPEKHNEYVKKWQADNPEKCKKIRTKAYTKKYRTFKGKKDRKLATLMHMLLKGGIKSSPFLERATGKNSQQIIAHFQSLFLSGMTWLNYGTEWEIDHKIAKALLPYSDIKDPNFKKRWSLENLQPLWKKDNRKKGVNNA